MSVVYHKCTHLSPECGILLPIVITTSTENRVRKPRLNEPVTRGTFHLPRRHALRLKELATEDGRSFNAEVRDAVALYLAVRRERR